MKKNYILAGCCAAALFAFGSASASFDDDGGSYQERNINISTHSFDQEIDNQIGDEQAKTARDRRLGNLVSDPNDYKLESDADSSTQKSKPSSKKHKKVNHNADDNDK